MILNQSHIKNYQGVFCAFQRCGTIVSETLADAHLFGQRDWSLLFKGYCCSWPWRETIEDESQGQPTHFMKIFRRKCDEIHDYESF